MGVAPALVRLNNGNFCCYLCKTNMFRLDCSMEPTEGIENYLELTLREQQLIPDGGRVLVAVSGGMDSVCLLYSLLALTKAGYDFSLMAAHVDHGLRPESGADAQFVAQLCAELGIECYVKHVDVQALATQRKQGLEEVGREVRREFLQVVAERESCDRIALAHHRDDQAETVLFRIARGCALSGLAAMRWENGLFIRPFLAASRQQIEEYIQRHAISYVEDASNASVVYARNRLRHQVLPALCSINPEVAARLAQLAQVAALEESYWQQQVATVVQRGASWVGSVLHLDCGAVAQEHSALLARVIRECLRLARGNLSGIEAKHIALVLTLLADGRPQRQLSLPRVWVARRYGQLLFSACPPATCDNFHLTIAEPGRFPLPGGRVLCVTVAELAQGDSGVLGSWGNWVEFDASQVRFPLWVRSVQHGDSMNCVGMVGRKKIKKIFAEKKLTLEQRALSLVLGFDNELLWLLGVRRCGSYMVQSDTSIVLRCTIVPAPD